MVASGVVMVVVAGIVVMIVVRRSGRLTNDADTLDIRKSAQSSQAVQLVRSTVLVCLVGGYRASGRDLWRGHQTRKQIMQAVV